MALSRPRVQALLLAVLVAWLAWGAGSEVFRAFERSWWRPPHERPPSAWRFSTPPAQRLQGWLTRMRAHVPPGSRIAFSSPRTQWDAPIFRSWWATYWLPDYVVLPAPPPKLKPPAQPVDFWVTYGMRLDDPNLELVHEEWAGAIYRERPQP